MQSPRNLAIIAAAGSHKTEYVVEQALAANRRVLITTYTNQNLTCILERIQSKVGCLPAHITLMSWYQFLLNQWCRPYQRALLKQPGLIRSVDFESTRPQRIKQERVSQYYLNKGGDLYRDWTADFAVKLNAATGGAVVSRLEEMYEEIFVDEVQDLVGYDLDVLEYLLMSSMHLTMVGDPRQHTYSSNQNMKHHKYQGAGLVEWLIERSDICSLETRAVSYRCNQAICDFGDGLYPELEVTSSANDVVATPSGVLFLSKNEARSHIEAHQPVVLRWSAASSTLGYPAINFGVSKGRTYDHVVIFPTAAMKQYLDHGDPSKLADGAKSKLYVGVTRARHSVAFVI